MTDATKETLEARAKNYGVFAQQAMLAQHLKEDVRQHPNWKTMNHDSREAIDMVLHKIARVVNGNENYADSWHDIGGYARLVEERINGNQM